MNRKRDENLESDLQQLSETYRGLATEQPPELVDQAVLNRARRELSKRAARPWNFGWIHGLTTAAIIVIGVALFLHQPRPATTEPLRVAKPPSSALRDVEAERVPLRIPAESRARQASPAPPQGQPERQSQETAAADAAAYKDAGRSMEEADLQAAGAMDEKSPAAEPLQESPVAAETPEAWLARILELKRQGNEEAVERELAAFRQAWPDFVLPPELAN